MNFSKSSDKLESMLDLRSILENTAAVKQNLSQRNFDVGLIDEISSLGKKRLECLHEVEKLKASRNDLSKEIGHKKQKKENADDLMAQVGKIGDRIRELDQVLAGIEKDIEFRAQRVPNLLHETVPKGKSSEDNKEIRRGGQPPAFQFQAKTHDELGEALKILDFERAAKITGARFTLYWGDAAKLERALIQFMLDVHTKENGYTEVLPPFIVNRKTLIGTGQLPKFEEDLFRLDLKDVDYFLIPTAEVPVTNIYADEIVPEEKLPFGLCAYSPCFRAEAGSYGKDTKGLIRQHQFNKVELVRMSTPAESMNQLELMTSHAEGILKKLDLHFRTVALCAGDIGFGATKTYDLEVWLPGQKAFREISSCSNCGDFQARRAQIRYRGKNDKKPQLLHTLNGSGLAVGRTLIAIFENFQDQGGKIFIPKALQPYMGGKTHLDPMG